MKGGSTVGGFKVTIEYKVMLDDLRKYRNKAGHTASSSAAYLNCSLSKVSRIEQGKARVSLKDLNALMELYKVPREERIRLRHLRSQASRRKDLWWESYGWISPGYAETIEAEDAALVIRTVQGGFVPGLLQTESYVRHLSEVYDRNDDERIDEVVEVRERRKNVLTRPKPPIFEALLAESVLSIGTDAVLKEQLQALRGYIDLPNVTLRVIGDREGIPLVDGTCFALPLGKEKHAVDLGGFSVVLDDPTFMKRAQRRLDRTLKYALSPEETKTLIEYKIKEL